MSTFAALFISVPEQWHAFAYIIALAACMFALIGAAVALLVSYLGIKNPYASESDDDWWDRQH